jgi:hypothetical protein
VSKDLKALTVINLPYIDERYEAGATISYDRFVASEEQGKALIGDQVISADEQIADLIENGSLSEDPDAALHPQNVVPDPSRRTVASVVAQASALVAELEEADADVPAKLRALAEMSATQVSASDAAIGDDRVVGQ